MDELEKNPIKGIWYKAFLVEGTNTFMHVNISDDGLTKTLNDVEQFTKFRLELKASEPISPPKSENLIMI